MKFKLSTKITVAGAETNEIELREPTTKDVRKFGMPYKIKADGSVEINMDVAGNYISGLSNLTDGDVNSLPLCDFQTIAMELIAFLGGQMANTQVTA